MDSRIIIEGVVESIYKRNDDRVVVSAINFRPKLNRFYNKTTYFTCATSTTEEVKEGSTYRFVGKLDNRNRIIVDSFEEVKNSRNKGDQLNQFSGRGVVESITKTDTYVAYILVIDGVKLVCRSSFDLMKSINEGDKVSVVGSYDNVEYEIFAESIQKL